MIKRFENADKIVEIINTETQLGKEWESKRNIRDLIGENTWEVSTKRIENRVPGLSKALIRFNRSTMLWEIVFEKIEDI